MSPPRKEQDDDAIKWADDVETNRNIVDVGVALDEPTSLGHAHPNSAEVAAALAILAAAHGHDEIYDAKRKQFRAQWAAGQRPPGVLSVIIRAMNSNDGSTTHAAAAIAVDVGEIAVPALLEVAERDAGFGVAAAGRALAALGVKRARSRLAIVAGKESSLARFDALESLSRLGDPRGLAQLMEHANAPSAQTRETSASCLGGAGDVTAGDLLLGLTLDPEARVRCAAASALGELAESKQIVPLRRLLSDATLLVRVFAAGALASFDDSDGVPTLLGAARSPNNTAARTAARFFLLAHRAGDRIAPLIAPFADTLDAIAPDIFRQADTDGLLSRLRWRPWFKPA